MVFFCFLISCGTSAERKEGFEFRQNEQGLDLYESGDPVFHYQREPGVIGNQYICNNYLHPLYSLDGDTLTEEAPEDHPYHRGIYWAWHQIYINDQSIADGWIMENISQEVIRLTTWTDESTAVLEADVLWKSPLWHDRSPFVREHTVITTHRKEELLRIIDFEIGLRALTNGVSIGGSDDEKGYGGFCARIKLPDDVAFVSGKGTVMPQNLQIDAGAWIDISGSLGSPGRKSGLAIICDPQTPNYPAPWILRQKGSMQNIVYPGRQRVTLPVDSDLVLKYRIIVHSGQTDYLTDKKVMID
ncbi:MAG TPA: PmoA family protein [Bacteroidales bacterium]|nr:hypothetical protein [Bacteroidales bacterium]HNR41349.1 PmoA family protein [Bacteroidales bacterium]